MRLPVLSNPPDDSVLKTCIGHDNCSTCKLYVDNGGICAGCTSKHKENLMENMKYCHQGCSTCTGFDVRIPGVCCRSPHKDLVFNALCGDNWSNPTYNYTMRKKIRVRHRGLLYIANGGGPSIANQHKSGLLVDPAEHDVIAVNLPNVWSGRGFYSADLHSYLRIPKSVKLLLMMMCKDDLLERFWDTEAYADPEKLEKAGISYWMPPAFSAYVNEAHMHQYYQWVRTMRTAERGKAWFMSANFRRVGLRLDDQFLAALQHMPQMTFNLQFGINEAILKRYLSDIVYFHKLAPPNVSFWMVGTCTPTFVNTVRSLVGSRDVYYVSANVYMSAIKGKRVFVSGRVAPDEKTSRWDLIAANIANFRKMVDQYG